MKTTRLAPECGVLVQPSPGETIEDLDAAAVLDELRLAGALLFRGFGAGVDSFRAFTCRFSDAFAIHNGGAHVPLDSADPKTRRVTSGSHAIDLHSENAGLPNRPDFLWLCCLTPPAAGGETTLCDGAAILDRLGEATRSAFEARKLKYVPPGGVIAARQWTEVLGTTDTALARSVIQAALEQHLDPRTERVEYEFDSDHALHLTYFVSAIVKGKSTGVAAFANSIHGPYKSFPTFEDDSPIAPELIEEVDAVASVLTVAVAWRAGDVLMIDNWRMMHGRRAFDDAGRQIAHRMAGERCVFHFLR